MYKLVAYIPEKNLEHVKRALFDAGGGKLGNYDCCSWQVKGTGQFRPLDGSEPNIGNLGEVEVVTEYRLEMLVEESVAKDVKKALLETHPYEEPAFEFYACINL